jgi:hypothetical protein
MSNLRLLNQTTVSSAVTTVNITDVFSADYDIYKIVLSNTTASATVDLDLRFINSSGSVISSSDYAYANQRLRQSGFNELKSQSDTDIQLGFGQVANALGSGAVSYVFNPFSSSSYTFYIMQNETLSGTEHRGFKLIGALKQVNSITGFQAVVGADTLTSATFKTYGLRVD